jgi:hypothetical protein
VIEYKIFATVVYYTPEAHAISAIEKGGAKVKGMLREKIKTQRLNLADGGRAG